MLSWVCAAAVLRNVQQGTLVAWLCQVSYLGRVTQLCQVRDLGLCHAAEPGEIPELCHTAVLLLVTSLCQVSYLSCVNSCAR